MRRRILGEAELGRDLVARAVLEVDTEDHAAPIPKERWAGARPEVRILTGTSADGAEHLKGCRAELEGALSRLEIGASRGGGVQVQADKLVFCRDRSEGLPESALALSEEVGKRLPKVELADLLIEVDRWTGFLGAFEHAAGSQPRAKDLNVHLLASVLSRATNLGPANMAELSGLSYRRLAWAANWYVREETLKGAIAAVVDHHHRLSLSRRWGGGTLSSSDGQRFPVAVKARNARALPPYFGYGRGVTLYSWTSDQFKLGHKPRALSRSW